MKIISNIEPLKLAWFGIVFDIRQNTISILSLMKGKENTILIDAISVN